MYLQYPQAAPVFAASVQPTANNVSAQKRIIALVVDSIVASLVRTSKKRVQPVNYVCLEVDGRERLHKPRKKFSRRAQKTRKC
jgi:hypothetical protein